MVPVCRQQRKLASKSHQVHPDQKKISKALKNQREASHKDGQTTDSAKRAQFASSPLARRARAGRHYVRLKEKA